MPSRRVKASKKLQDRSELYEGEIITNYACVKTRKSSRIQRNSRVNYDELEYEDDLEIQKNKRNDQEEKENEGEGEECEEIEQKVEGEEGDQEMDGDEGDQEEGDQEEGEEGGQEEEEGEQEVEEDDQEEREDGDQEEGEDGDQEEEEEEEEKTIQGLENDKEDYQIEELEAEGECEEDVEMEENCKNEEFKICFDKYNLSKIQIMSLNKMLIESEFMIIQENQLFANINKTEKRKCAILQEKILDTVKAFEEGKLDDEVEQKPKKSRKKKQKTNEELSDNSSRDCSLEINEVDKEKDPEKYKRILDKIRNRNLKKFLIETKGEKFGGKQFRHCYAILNQIIKESPKSDDCDQLQSKLDELRNSLIEFKFATSNDLFKELCNIIKNQIKECKKKNKRSRKTEQIEIDNKSNSIIIILDNFKDFCENLFELIKENKKMPFITKGTLKSLSKEENENEEPKPEIKNKKSKMYSEEEYLKIQQKNIALETQIQILQQKVLYYEFEKRHQEKLKNQVQDEDRNKLREKLSTIPEDLLRKIALKAKVEYPHFVDSTTREFTIPIDTISLEEFKGLRKIINTVIKNFKNSKKGQEKQALMPQSENELNKSLGLENNENIKPPINGSEKNNVFKLNKNVLKKKVGNIIPPMCRPNAYDSKSKEYVKELIAKSKEDSDLIESEDTSDDANDSFDLNII